MKLSRALPIAASFLFVSFCPAQEGLQGLRDYLTQHNYQVLASTPGAPTVPLDSIITFKKGVLSIAVTGCIDGNKVAALPSAPVQLASREGKLDRTAFEGWSRIIKFSLDAGFSKQLDPKVDIGKVFGDPRVQNVSVTLGEVLEKSVALPALKDEVSSLKKSCREAATDPRDLIVGSLIEVTSVQYAFLDAQGRPIKLDDNLLDAMKMSPPRWPDFRGEDSLNVTRPTIVAYRPYRATDAQGHVELTEATAPEVERLRKTSMAK